MKKEMPSCAASAGLDAPGPRGEAVVADIEEVVPLDPERWRGRKAREADPAYFPYVMMLNSELEKLRDSSQPYQKRQRMTRKQRRAEKHMVATSTASSDPSSSSSSSFLGTLRAHTSLPRCTASCSVRILIDFGL